MLGPFLSPASSLKPYSGVRNFPWEDPDLWTTTKSDTSGFPSCFGVFQNYYSEMGPELEGDTANIALIGTLAQGLVQLGSPLSALLVKKFPKYQRQQIWLGWPLCILGLLCASFTSSVNGLIGTQGVLYGVGFVTLNLPIMSMLNEWWIARKGMAFGLISASSGLTGAFLPPVIELSLRQYGHRTTLRGCAVALAVLSAPLMPLLKGRLPASEHTGLAKINWAIFKRPLFWIYGTAILIQGLGFWMPSIFLPSYATSLNLPSSQGALLLVAMCIAQVLGQFAFGYLSDKRFSVAVLSIICCITAAAASSTLWGLGKSAGLLATFSLIYGFFGFGFGTMRVAMSKAVDNDASSVFTLFSVFIFLQGIGNVLVGPLSAALLTPTIVRGKFGAERFTGVIALTASAWVLAALVIGSWHGYKRIMPS